MWPLGDGALASRWPLGSLLLLRLLGRNEQGQGSRGKSASLTYFCLLGVTTWVVALAQLKDRGFLLLPGTFEKRKPQ